MFNICEFYIMLLITAHFLPNLSLTFELALRTVIFVIFFQVY